MIALPHDSYHFTENIMFALRRILVSAAVTAFAATASVCAQAADASPTEGSVAPNFKLPDQAGTQHSLSDYKGKWVVLYFYPKDETSGCTTQACELRDNIFAFKKADAVILGVSADDVASHKEFAENHKLPFTILADPEKKVIEQYGVAWSPAPGVKLASRQTFLIGPDGKIVKHWAKVDPKGHSDMVLAEIKAHSADKAPAKTG
jgi:peroxiredoxin Q/BCP